MLHISTHFLHVHYNSKRPSLNSLNTLLKRRGLPLPLGSLLPEILHEFSKCDLPLLPSCLLFLSTTAVFAWPLLYPLPQLSPKKCVSAGGPKLKPLLLIPGSPPPSSSLVQEAVSVPGALQLGSGTVISAEEYM